MYLVLRVIQIVLVSCQFYPQFYFLKEFEIFKIFKLLDLDVYFLYRTPQAVSFFNYRV